MRRVSVALLLSGSIARRAYTPIWKPAAPEDHLIAKKTEDEARVLWGPQRDPIPTVSAATDFLVRFGYDPCLNDTWGQRSVFAEAEDYLGTNIVNVQNKPLMKESIAFWTQYFDGYYSNVLRQGRRAAANNIGTLSGIDSLRDEADDVSTKWNKDSHFRELRFMAKRFLEAEPSNMQQFERAIRAANAAKLQAFAEVFRYHNPAKVPVPSASCWHYEGDRMKAWCEKYKEIQGPAISFGEKLLALTENGKTWPELAAKIAAVFTEINVVLKARFQRQLGGKEWSALSNAEKDEYCGQQAKLLCKSVIEGDFDPEGDDTSEGFLGEKLKIQELLDKELAAGVTAGSFWLNTVRFEEFETEHLYVTEKDVALHAAALRRVLDENGPEAAKAALPESIARSTIDAGNGVVAPHATEVWCKLNWVKFGSGSVAIHTPAAQRLMHYNYGTLAMVKAAAKLHFQLKPLGSRIDYSSPHKHRLSIVAMCADYGVSLTHATHQPFCVTALSLQVSENAMSIVNKAAREKFGVHRRAQQSFARKAALKQLDPIDMASVVGQDDKGAGTTWAFGSARAVKYAWKPSGLVEYEGNPGNVGEVEHVQRALNIEQRYSMEISLWRDVGTEALTAAKAKMATDAESLIKQYPRMKDVADYADKFYSSLTGTDAAKAAAESETSSKYTFVCMMDDRRPVNSNQTSDVLLPYRDSVTGEKLSEGNYCLRVRCFDNNTNPSHDPSLCVETTTAPFYVFDAFPQLATEVFSEVPASFRGSDLLKLCERLRSGGMSIPLQLEFEAGQTLGTKGEVFTDEFVKLLESGKHQHAGANAALSPQQLEAEPRIRQHWEMLHPGAAPEEWAGARRAVLDNAFTTEREWWREDTAMRVTGLDTIGCTKQYCSDVCTILTANASDRGVAPPPPHEHPLVTATYSGDGTVPSLEFDASQAQGKGGEQLLAAATSAINNAQVRLNTLATVKTQHTSKQMTLHSVMGAQSCEFGGRHARTYNYAYKKALAELDGAPIEELIREKEVDRFASTTHPEQRRKLWAASANIHNGNADVPQPSVSALWKS